MGEVLSRRRFLQLSAATATGAALAACAPMTPEPEEEEKGTAPPKEAADVRILLSSWAIAEVPFDRMAREYSEQNPGVEIKIESAFEGWDTKVLGQIREGNLEWSGVGIVTPFLNIVEYVETEMIQPMGDYIDSSGVEGSDQVLDDMIVTVEEDSSYKGHFYSLPYSFENITFQWHTDHFGEVGVKEAPESWDEWYSTCVELKKYFKAEDEEIFATALSPPLWRSIGGLICGASDDPYTDEGLINWDSEAMREVLKFYRKLVWEELTPPLGGEASELVDMWKRDRLASFMSCSSRGVWAQKIFGPEKIVTSRIPTIDGKEHSGSAFWGNGLAILNECPYPQEVTDFYIYAMGPQNKDWQKSVIRSGKTPVYNSAYEKILKTDPMFKQYRWMLDMREDVEASLPVPRNTYYLIQNSALQKWRPEFLKKGSDMTVDELVKNILEYTRKEIEEQEL